MIIDFLLYHIRCIWYYIKKFHVIEPKFLQKLERMVSDHKIAELTNP